jgi:putative transposase
MSNREHMKYPCLLKGLKITQKKEMRATDTTYNPTVKGFMYLTMITDLHTRFVLN